jgi:hypothetical protein
MLICSVANCIGSAKPIPCPEVLASCDIVSDSQNHVNKPFDGTDRITISGDLLAESQPRVASNYSSFVCRGIGSACHPSRCDSSANSEYSCFLLNEQASTCCKQVPQEPNCSRHLATEPLQICATPLAVAETAPVDHERRTEWQRVDYGQINDQESSRSID